MALKTAQMRYLYDGSPNNYPANLTADMLTSGSFFDSSIRIVKLEIQGSFDLAFYINDTITPIRIAPSDLRKEDLQKWSSDSITLQKQESGKYLTDVMPIYNVRFDARSLKHFLETNTKRIDPSDPQHKKVLENYLFITYTYDTVV